MKIKLCLLFVFLTLVVSGNFYSSVNADIAYNQVGTMHDSYFNDTQFVNKDLLALQAGDEAIIAAFWANPGRFLGKIEKEVSFNQLYSEGRFYRKIECSAYYRSTLNSVAE